MKINMKITARVPRAGNPMALIEVECESINGEYVVCKLDEGWSCRDAAKMTQAERKEFNEQMDQLWKDSGAV